jgi:hypothetical protein
MCLKFVYLFCNQLKFNKHSVPIGSSQHFMAGTKNPLNLQVNQIGWFGGNMGWIRTLKLRIKIPIAPLDKPQLSIKCFNQYATDAYLITEFSRSNRKLWPVFIFIKTFLLRCYARVFILNMYFQSSLIFGTSISLEV